MPAVEMLHEEDPKEVILRKVGDISGLKVWGNDVLVAIYQRPEQTKGGLFITDEARDEDKSQGKVGLVIKMGPVAYVDDEGRKYRDINVGDWVVGRAGDGWAVTLNTRRGNLSKDNIVPCRVFVDHSLRLGPDHPD